MRRLGLVLLLVAGCGGGDATFTEPVVLGGQEVSPEVLNRGQFAYMRYCRGCHGMQGAGDGPYAASLEPRPRNLTLGEYPHLGATDGALPTDDQLRSLVRNGIEGSAMGPLPMGEADVEGVIQYVKTLSPRWRATDPPAG